MAKAKTKDEDPKRLTPVKRDGAYVMMLFISLLAIAGGAVLMHLDHEEYGGKSPPKEPELKILPLGAKANISDGPGATPPAPPPDPGGGMPPMPPDPGGGMPPMPPGGMPPMPPAPPAPMP